MPLRDEPTTVLVVHPHRAFRARARAALEDAGLVVREAGSDDEAVQEAVRARPDVCLVAVSVLRALGPGRLARACPGVGIVLVCGAEDRPGVVETLRLGARGYVEAAADGDRLVAAALSAARGELALPPRLMDDLLDLVAPGRTHGVGDLAVPITRREADVALLLRDGRTTQEIAWELSISPVTVRRHISSLAARLGVKGRDEVLRRLRPDAPA